MQETRSAAQEAAEDIFFGQVVLIWARWAIIFAGAVLVLWTATTYNEISINILLVVALMAMNFFLHGRYLMERPANRGLVVIVSLLDIVIVTAIVLVWRGQGGLHSPLFIFYYPVLLAFALVFPPRSTVGYTIVALTFYVAASAGTIEDTAGWKTMVTRLITLAATAGLGTFYWRIQRDRRRMTSTGRMPELPVRPATP